MSAWWRGWQNSSSNSAASKNGAQRTGTSTQALATALPRVTINLRVLVAHHPAWKLACALEASAPQNRGAQLNLSTYKIPELHAVGSPPVALKKPSFDVSFSAASVMSSTSPPGTPQFAGYERAAATVAAQGLDAFENQARDRQSESIQTFLQDITERQASARNQYAEILRAALDEEVENTQRATVEEPPIPQMAPDKQLLLTNLRLQLLRNVFSSDEQKQRARAQLDALLADWQKQLNAQAAQRSVALQEARVEVPRRAREAGVLRIRAELEAVRRAQQNARELVLRQQQERLREDFGDHTSQLEITLPAASWMPPSALEKLPDFLRASASEKINFGAANFLETNLRLPSSSAPFLRADKASVPDMSTPAMAFGGTTDQRSELIHALKAEAWHDARKQAQMAARRFGWQWQEAKKSNATLPDRTKETVQWLFG